MSTMLGRAVRLSVGGVIVPPGYTHPVKFVEGNPYGVSHVTGAGNDIPVTDPTLEALEHLATRVVDVAARLAA